jgi:hypothetical protein
MRCGRGDLDNRRAIYGRVLRGLPKPPGLIIVGDVD